MTLIPYKAVIKTLSCNYNYIYIYIFVFSKGMTVENAVNIWLYFTVLLFCGLYSTHQLGYPLCSVSVFDSMYAILAQ